MSDKMSTDDNARELRRNILKQYYPLYKAVYYKEYHSTEETPIEIDLFLRYGFLSETLLTEELLEELLRFRWTTIVPDAETAAFMI